MALSNILPGKQAAIDVSGGGVPHQPPERAAHAPMFARPGEREPNVTMGERLQPSRPGSKPVPTRTRRDAHAKGCAPEALDVGLEELDS